MFKQILVSLDGSVRAERALPIAARIAHASDGTVILLRANSSNAGGHVRRESVHGDAMDATGYLATVAHTNGLDGEGMKVVVCNGPDALTILDAAKELHADLVVIAALQSCACTHFAG